MTETAQITDLLSRYQAAERLIPYHWKDLVVSGRVNPNWISGTDRFWYAHRSRRGIEWVLVDPSAGSRVPAFDHAALAVALSSALGRRVEAAELPIDRLEIRNGEPLRLDADGKCWLWNPASSALTPAGLAPRQFLDSVSPDGHWAVTVREHNLVIRDLASGAEQLLTSDGMAGYSYGTQTDVGSFRFVLDLLNLQMPPALAWSPDSRRLVSHRIDQRSLPYMHYVQSSPGDGGRPRLYTDHYAMVGEKSVPAAELVVIDVETGKLTWARTPGIIVPSCFSSPITLRHVWWAPDGQHIYVISGERGDQIVRLYRLNPDTGEAQLLVEDNSDTHVQTNPLGFGPPNVRVLATGETIWWSESSGWGHLYLYRPDGSVRQLTDGDWLVRDVVTVNEQARAIVFTGAGREPGLDPYVRQIYRVCLDTGEIERLTDDLLDHDVTGTPSGRYLVDVTSWIDAPEASVLRDADGALVVPLECGDAELLFQAGWDPPERFTVKASDGATDLYGILYKPHGFDPGARYPILDDIYPGPQQGAVTIRLSPKPGAAQHAASMAALGFAVVVVDGRGTPLRSKAFQDHCRGEHDADYLADHVAAIRQLAATRPWLDLDRVGIYGHSGGGRASTQALLCHPEFFKVAVSSAGNHDDRLNHAGWGEKYVGLPGVGHYQAHDNSARADQLQGKLLLIHGELDNNVHPCMTLRLASALISANKDFDLLIVPGADHTMLVSQAYWLRRRWDYFVRHLHGLEPPQYRIADIPLDPDWLLAVVSS